MWERDLMDVIPLPMETKKNPPSEGLKHDLCFTGDRTECCSRVSSGPFNIYNIDEISKKRKFHEETIADNQDDLEKNFLMYGMDTLSFDIEASAPTPCLLPSVIKSPNNSSKQGSVSNQKVLKEPEDHTILDWSTVHSVGDKLLDLAGSSKSCTKYKEIASRLCFKLASSISRNPNTSQKNNLMQTIDNMIEVVAFPFTAIKVEPDEVENSMIKQEKYVRPPSQVSCMMNYLPTAHNFQRSMSFNKSCNFDPFVPLHCSSLDWVNEDSNGCVSMEGSDKIFHSQDRHKSNFPKSTFEDNDILSFEDTWVESFFESF
jgi:hypothetical protein